MSGFLGVSFGEGLAGFEVIESEKVAIMKLLNVLNEREAENELKKIAKVQEKKVARIILPRDFVVVEQIETKIVEGEEAETISNEHS